MCNGHIYTIHVCCDGYYINTHTIDPVCTCIHNLLSNDSVLIMYVFIMTVLFIMIVFHTQLVFFDVCTCLLLIGMHS